MIMAFFFALAFLPQPQASSPPGQPEGPQGITVTDKPSDRKPLSPSDSKQAAEVGEKSAFPSANDIGLGAERVEMDRAARAHVGKQVASRLRSTEFLRLTIEFTDGTVHWTASYQAARDKFRCEIRGTTDLEFAIFKGAGKCQEYVRKMTFPNGHQAGDVLVEYASGGAAASEWPLTVEPAFACEFGNLSTTCLDPSPEGQAARWARQLERAQSVWSVVVNNTQCLAFAESNGAAPGDKLGVGGSKILYVNRETMDVVERRDTQTENGGTIRREYKYTLVEHAKSDQGWTWELARAQFAKAVQSKP